MMGIASRASYNVKLVSAHLGHGQRDVHGGQGVLAVVADEPAEVGLDEECAFD
jgi:hypothetical protein